jgi:hypothetical protein|uniref:hypothetical protein n=1 Tax=Cyanobium sp. TaxID=2164130 RepID=UPI00404759B1
MGSLNHLMAPYANALAISLLAMALIVLGLKDQRCEKPPSRTPTSSQAAPSQSNSRRPVVTQNRRELSKF